MKPNKACPIVLRRTPNGLEILAFEHPLSGLQIIKGKIEPGEPPADAAVRELREESGIAGVVTADLGLWESGHEEQIWSLHLCEPSQPLPDTWEHLTADDDGHVFKFFWHPLGEAPSDRWHSLYKDALSTIEMRLARIGKS
ncbi:MULTISPECIES: NUDIX hydrolase [Cupriavidus]|uniref:NUDIX domain-containing protein n=1 Tax=Cupriavidus oxalaticus TaxID=96344 RepID=A0A4P7L3J5_9BURK|nr:MULTISPECIES: NUDIX domain-containing protein [Cupriavidus]MBF6991858.1 NUDIX domain-containing protein [Cupriavidus sp. IK-TO18]QBY49840.1 NUDIX domain-containing protein [Cupriavidus oxalaticus]TDF65662.1 NUDIX domain-containing protein [Cupriavidus sp. L7L]